VLTLAAVGDVALLRPPSATLFRDGWASADLCIANLESPLCDGGELATKLIRLRSPRAAAEWLRDLGCHAVALANNHAMDYGLTGLRSTLEVLDTAGIRWAGAGRSAAEAERPVILEQNGPRIAFFSWACTLPPGFRARGNEPGIAGIRVRTAYLADALLIDEQPGTPPWVQTAAWDEDVERLTTAMRQARQETDFVVLAMHWGVPPQWASPFQGPLAEYQIALAPRLVEGGADLILGHHAHTVYGAEHIRRTDGSSGLVLYSLGNYVFHPYGDRSILELDAPSVPYHAHEVAENSETYVVTLRLEAESGSGRLQVAEARFLPAHLDDQFESVRATDEQAERIAARVVQFSQWRETPVSVDNGGLVWRP
jgi:poly-gamma-glutamate capsule biosynthesis protein CapA/YwtB (metallophosphatase superfamily)